MVVCLCAIFPTVTLIGCVLTLYHATSLFTCSVTASILLIVLVLLLPNEYQIVTRKNRTPSHECLKVNSGFPLYLVGLCLFISVLCGGVLYGYSTIICMFKECCTKAWIVPNVTGLSLLLHEKVFGQHIATSAITKLLKGHLETNPQKPLVLSLHGLSGTGKSYVTRMVAENMYTKGMNSRYVHFISASNDIPNDVDLDDYKTLLKTQIETAVDECPRSFFIFDEMDKMPDGLLDTLHTYLDFNVHVKGVDHRQSIVFLLSNTGGKEITKHVMESKAKGLVREQLSLKDLESVISDAAYNESGGLFQSTLISSNLISTYVPFLPLERNHVKQCIAEEMFAKDLYKFDHQVDKDEVDMVAEEFEYFPNDTQLFSKSGCKRVSEKVKLYIRDE